MNLYIIFHFGEFIFQIYLHMYNVTYCDKPLVQFLSSYLQQQNIVYNLHSNYKERDFPGV